MTEPSEAAVRVTLSERRANEWALVLAAEGIEHRIEETDAGFALLVGWGDVGHARAVLAAYDEESAVAPPPPPPATWGAIHGDSWLGYGVAAALLALFAWSGPGDAGGRLLDRGSAASHLLLHGQWWRAVTALTLHMDVAHLAGNVVATLVFVTAVGRWIGPGLGALGLLLSGALGNLATALVHGPHHDSIGASTATFGAMGLLAALGIAARLRGQFAGRKPWVIAAAALALLGLLGTGKGSDVFAHLFGLLLGGALGAVAALAFRKPPGRAVQWPLTALSALTVAAAWWRALH